MKRAEKTTRGSVSSTRPAISGLLRRAAASAPESGRPTIAAQSEVSNTKRTAAPASGASAPLSVEKREASLASAAETPKSVASMRNPATVVDSEYLP